MCHSTWCDWRARAGGEAGGGLGAHCERPSSGIMLSSLSAILGSLARTCRTNHAHRAAGGWVPRWVSRPSFPLVWEAHITRWRAGNQSTALSTP